MTILVTGGAGYVGMNVVEALLADDERVVLLDRGPLPPAVRRVLGAHGSRVEVVDADVRDAGAVANAYAGRGITGVIHCAAVTSGPEREAGDPASVLEVNLKGTINVLDGARRNSVRRVVYVSSGAAYGESLYRLQRLYEDASPSFPLTLYAITKHAAERMCLRLRELWSMDVVCARLGTVIGPWERNTGVRDNFGTHSQLALYAATGKQAILPARETRRDWVYCRDVAAGLLALLDAQAARHTVYNLSSGVEWGSNAVAAWCETLKTIFPEFGFRVAHPGETPNIGYTDRDRYPMDVGRIVNEFGVRLRGPLDAYADYAQWLAHTPDFSSL